MDDDQRGTDGYTAPAPGTEVSVEVERRRSRFLAVLRRAHSVEDAQELVDALRRRHHDARHHCSAWVVGPQRHLRRAHDDGEPSGTAGAPILEALTHTTMPSGAADLSDVVVVVVRWFGGMLLGAGGLVSAYSDATTAAVRELVDGGHLVRRRRLRQHTVLAPIAEAGRWEHELRSQGVAVEETDYAPGELLGGTSAQPAARLHLAVPDDDHASDRLAALLAELSAGTAAPEPGPSMWSED